MTYYMIYFKGSTNDAWGYPEPISYASGTSVTLPQHIPARTGFSFSRWDTMQDGSGTRYAPGQTLENLSGDVYLYAQWSPLMYLVRYYPKDGIDGFEDQIKEYNVDLQLSTAIPIRSGYTFKGWSVLENSIEPTYQPGDTYTENSQLYLYAVWEVDYTKPRINSAQISRCTADGTDSDDGKYFAVSFYWYTDESATSYQVSWKPSNSTTWTNAAPIAISGTNGHVEGSIFGSNSISTENTYDVRITVSDAKGSTSYIGFVGSKSYTMDFMPGGSGAAFGKAAEKTDLLEVEWDAKFNGRVEFKHPVGTRNLLKYTKKLPVDSTLVYSDTGISASENASQVVPTENGAKLTYLEGSSCGMVVPLVSDSGIKSGETMTLSFDYRGTLTDPGYLRIYGKTTSKVMLASYILTSYASLVNDSTNWNHLSITLECTKDITDYDEYFMEIFVNPSLAHNTSDKWIEIKKSSLQLNQGSMELAWSESPDDLVNSFVLAAYPVNSIYLSYSHVSPATLFGGTWERISPYYLYATSETGVIGEDFGFAQAYNLCSEQGGTTVYGIKISAWRRTA